MKFSKLLRNAIRILVRTRVDQLPMGVRGIFPFAVHRAGQDMDDNRKRFVVQRFRNESREKREGHSTAGEQKKKKKLKKSEFMCSRGLPHPCYQSRCYGFDSGR